MAAALSPNLAAVRAAKVPRYVVLLLILPSFFPLIYEWLSATPGHLATGFTHTDMPYYMANARQHFANGFHLTYGNPYAAYGTKRIYFQPQTLLLACLVKAGADPGLAYQLFGLLAQCFTALVAIRLYERFAGWETWPQKIGLWCLFWGGGVLSLFGLAIGHFTQMKPLLAAVSLDPNDGWWLLNFGRNLVMPMEAYYHGLFLLAILLVMEKRFHWALVVCAWTSLSHPFTGLSLAAVLAAYSLLECALGHTAAHLKLLLGSLLVGAAHLGYYLIFLNRLPEHHVLQTQWLFEWVYPAWTCFCALMIVGVLAFTRLSHGKILRAEIAQPETRLLLVWFAVIFALTHHDLVIRPIQPIHFARGYDWLALFFLALPSLLPVLEKLLAFRNPVGRAIALAAFLAVIFSDNLLWFATFQDHSIQRYAISFTPDEKSVLHWLAARGAPETIVATDDENLSYLTPTYTDLRSWYGHPTNTPYYLQRKKEVHAAFTGGPYLTASQPLYYIAQSDSTSGSAWQPPAGASLQYQNHSFSIWSFAPAGTVNISRTLPRP